MSFLRTKTRPTTKVACGLGLLNAERQSLQNAKSCVSDVIEQKQAWSEDRCPLTGTLDDTKSSSVDVNRAEQPKENQEEAKRLTDQGHRFIDKVAATEHPGMGVLMLRMIKLQERQVQILEWMMSDQHRRNLEAMGMTNEIPQQR